MLQAEQYPIIDHREFKPRDMDSIIRRLAIENGTNPTEQVAISHALRKITSNLTYALVCFHKGTERDIAKGVYILKWVVLQLLEKANSIERATHAKATKAAKLPKWATSANSI
ncbi:hypothetical protein GGI04_001186 [Coemansia thaxteri]|nr:hypothetical protein GGI04_001186 [Coemansia thaxteri]